MSDLLSLAITPVVHAVAALLAGAHTLAQSTGLAAGSPGAWVAAIVLLVVAVRTALLPVTVHTVRMAHARARALPALRDARSRLGQSRDLASLQRHRDEQRRILREHGVPRWSLAPMLLQLPLFYALYRVVSDLAAGQPVGNLDAGVVASAAAASVVGVGLTSRLGDVAAHGLLGTAVLVGLALAAAALSWATQRWFVVPMTDPTDQPEALASIQRVMPWVGAAGVLAAAPFVPAALLVYWVANNAWTFLQQGAVWRFAPTPGSPAAARRGGASVG